MRNPPADPRTTPDQAALATGYPDPATLPWPSRAPALPPPAGPVHHVDTVDGLFAAAAAAVPGDTILLADGHYLLPTVFVVRTDRVTLRSASGDRDRVILDGAHSDHGELFGFTACRDVVVADLTIQNIMHNGFKLNANIGGGVRGIHIRNCVIHNIWQRGIKGVSGPVAPADSGLPLRPGSPGQPAEPREYVDDCVIRYCLFYNDRPKRLDDEVFEQEHPERFGGNYIAGIDAMSARGWLIADNVFVGIKGRTGGARGAIFLWQGTENVCIQRNRIIDCDSGMWLGLAFPEDDARVCRHFTVRDNEIWKARLAGILLNRHVDSVVRANTVHDPVPLDQRGEGTEIDDGGVLHTSRTPRSHPLRIGSGNARLRVEHNLVSGPSPVRVSPCAGEILLHDNRWITPEQASPFVDGDRGDLRLRADMGAEMSASPGAPQGR